MSPHIDTSIRSPNHEPRIRPIDMLVLHATAGGLHSALSWLTNPVARVSAHYVIAKNGTIYQLVPDARVAWHAGKSFWQGETDCNRFSVGIELVNLNTGTDPYPEAQYAATLALSRELVTRYQIPRDRVVRHLDISPGRKFDPRGFAWERFLSELFAPAAPSPVAYVTRAACWVRSAPHRGSNHITTLRAGEPIPVARLVAGERLALQGYGASDQWAELMSGGYIWLPQLEVA